MKKITEVLIIVALLFLNLGHAQEKKSGQQKDTIEQMNLVDAQFGILKDVMGGDENKENPLAGFENYEQLLLQSELDATLKKDLLQQYQLIEANTDPKQKDSLKLLFAQRLKKAMAESPKQKN